MDVHDKQASTKSMEMEFLFKKEAST